MLLEKKATGIYSSRVFAQFRVDYPISSDRISPRKREFTERFHACVSCRLFLFIMYEPKEYIST